MDAYKAYLQDEMSNSHPNQASIVMFQKIQGRMRYVKKMQEDFKFRTASVELEKMEKVFHELRLQMNPELPEELRDNLERMYLYLEESVLHMKRGNTSDRMESVHNMLNDLIEMYRHDMQQDMEGKSNGK